MSVRRVNSRNSEGTPSLLSSLEAKSISNNMSSSTLVSANLAAIATGMPGEWKKLQASTTTSEIVILPFKRKEDEIVKEKKEETQQQQEVPLKKKEAEKEEVAVNWESVLFLSKRKLQLGDFELGVTLGVGSFGRVRFCQFSEAMLKELKIENKSTAPVMAIKMLKKKEIIRKNQLDHIIAEKEIMMDIGSGRRRAVHPFIVRLFSSFQDSMYVYLVMEFVNGGEFFTYLRTMGRFEEPTAKFFCASVVSIFEYLHEDNIAYRDLKPENLLLGHDGFLKLTDFGFAKKVAFKTYTLCGTPEYLAPEVLLNQGHGKEVDWWTLGILTYEMLIGQPPFLAEETMEIYKLILSGKMVFPTILHSASKSLIKHLLDFDLTRRYGCRSAGADDVKNHRWLEGINYQALLSKTLPPPIQPTTTGPDDTGNFEEYRNSVDSAKPYIPDATTNHVDPFSALD